MWPTPAQSHLNTLYYLSVQRTVEDFDATANNPDFPQEWFLSLVYNTALLAAPIYCSPQRQQSIAALAKKFHDEVLDWSAEDTSLFIRPNRQQR